VAGVPPFSGNEMAAEAPKRTIGVCAEVGLGLGEHPAEPASDAPDGMRPDHVLPVPQRRWQALASAFLGTSRVTNT
jgi:hypothetical protein